MSDEWMDKTNKQVVINIFFDFMADPEDETKCVAIKRKQTGEVIHAGDSRINFLIEPEFKTLQEACFYDFWKDSLGIEQDD